MKQQIYRNSIYSATIDVAHIFTHCHHSAKIGRTINRLAAVSAEVNGSSPAKVDDPSLSIRLNVNEKARTVTSVCTSGTLCTVSGSDGIQGAPFGSYVDYVLDDDGNPVLLMNEMSMHTVNIFENKDGMVTLFTQLQSKTGSGAGQDISRCSVTGTIAKIDPKAADMDAIRMRYSITHSYADQVMDSPKFAFYRLTPCKIYFVGGFGVLAKWVDIDEYKNAKADILAKEAAEIVARINRDHADDLKLTAKHLLDVENAIETIRVTNVDRLGMDLRVTTQKGARRNKLITDEFRVGFRIPVISVEDAKSEVLKLFQEAWEKGNGYTWDQDDELPGQGVPIIKIAEDSLE
jgi:putative heme iron utilization protein